MHTLTPMQLQCKARRANAQSTHIKTQLFVTLLWLQVKTVHIQLSWRVGQRNQKRFISGKPRPKIAALCVPLPKPRASCEYVTMHRSTLDTQHLNNLGKRASIVFEEVMKIKASPRKHVNFTLVEWTRTYQENTTCSFKLWPSLINNVREHAGKVSCQKTCQLSPRHQSN